jgi:CheY-like chemotaxis protein
MRKTVLLAESEDNDLALLQRAVEGAGFADALQVVRSSTETIRFLAGEAPYHDRERYPFPALLLLGLNVGRPGGADVLRWLQQRAELKNRLPVVVLSSLESPQEMEAAYAWGANSYVVKPVDFQQLAALVTGMSDYWLRLNRLPHFC